ncbi:hypothetical protein CAEBREN_31605 [Caenorhabditis brenneri]|uniref:Uncharacterized protein n=1 Tax=Caenorhabditis brenneri TaxID=135651 RepID=G0NFF2_CAEBE|nr:hypothetical protein CAEBREN_31605 [Caenorhabditis brenneri]
MLSDLVFNNGEQPTEFSETGQIGLRFEPIGLNTLIDQEEIRD